MSGNTCDVCNREPVVGVASSSLGAISFAYCAECLNRRAEPHFMLIALYQDVGEDVADHVKELQTWVSGRYLTWTEMVNEAKNNQDEVFDTMMEVERNPQGAFEAIQSMGADLRKLRELMLAPSSVEVLMERQRQIKVEGFTTTTDDKFNTGDELTLAAICYIEASHQPYVDPPARWPYSKQWWKAENMRTNLIKGLALGLAALEQYDRRNKG